MTVDLDKGAVSYLAVVNGSFRATVTCITRRYSDGRSNYRTRG